MDNMDQEKGMNERRDQVPGGPAQEEVEEVNKQSLRSADLKPRPLRRPGFLGKIINTALGLSIAAGGVVALKAKAEENTVSQTPPQVEPSNNQEVQNTPPSAPGVKVEFPTADAPAEVEFKPTHALYLPNVRNNFTEAPLRFLNRIERPDARLVLFNRGKERGVKQGELFDNLVGFRQLFGKPDLPLELYFYDSGEQMRRESSIPVMFWGRGYSTAYPYGFWASTVNVYDDQGNRIETRQFPPTFEALGQVQSYLRDGRVMEVHLALPTPLPGMTPDPLQIDQVERISQSEVFLSIFSLDENGDNVFKREGMTPEIKQYIKDHPYVIRKSNQTVDQAALRMVLK